ncbi:MAG: DUF4838 domain-containing protein [Planctomycetota bacterium]|nr:DUF4838 domain-containing protein [Planctomycetota bacterium]
MLITSAADAAVTLIRDGKCDTAIYVASEVMEEKAAGANESAAAKRRDALRVRLRESVKDLALYLGKMTGVAVPIHLRPPTNDEKAVPILIGALAEPRFGAITMNTDFKQGYRLAVSGKGVGLQGETDEGTSYAVYELLDSLGCRWYIPGALGEVIPSLKEVTLSKMDRKEAPGTVSRNIWYADDAFKRRNRLGGFPYSAGHALESYITKAQLDQHPDWNAEMDGKRALQPCDVGHRLCWGNPEVSAAVADRIIAILEKEYAPCVSISPGDGINFCQCAKCKALDAGDMDPTMDCVSITDRYVHFTNQIAERVTAKFPEVKLGFLAYAQYTRPPLREKPHPALIPQLAPITYCRAHTLDDPACPSRQQVRMLLDGWGKVVKNMAMYEYNYHLAEVAAPFPMIRRSLVELPVQYANHVTMWTPETLPNFETAMPGLYIGMRMAWNPKANPRGILDEFHTKFHGAAAKPMADYWQCIDDCWTKVPEHAGCGFGYMRRFTPERMAEARGKMDAALRACKTEAETRRVKLADDSLRQHELFMKMRRDYFAGRHGELGSDVAQYVASHPALGENHKENYTFTRVGFAPKTLAVSYFESFFAQSYLGMARIGKESAIISEPILAWNCAADKERRGESQGWQKAEFDDTAWRKTDVAIDTWASLGLEGYFGPMWYRAQVRLQAAPAGKRVFLWVGATDGACKVYINGQPIPYVNAKGEKAAEANGFCEPFSFDITGAVKPDVDNQIAIVGTRNFLNELGTGGLLGPVLVYREK